MPPDYYDILGISGTASKDQIKESFRKLALKLHPGRHTQSSTEVKEQAIRRFKQVSEAYNVLSDDSKRKDYNFKNSAGSSSYYYSNSNSSSNSNGGYASYKGRSGGSYYYYSYSYRGGMDWDGLFRFVTRRGFLMNLAFVSVLFGEAVIFEKSGEALLKLNNADKSFEDTMKSVEKNSVKKARDPP